MEYTLEKLEVYQLSEAFSDIIWNITLDWDNFVKGTIGKQIVRSLILYLQILQKAMEDIITKRVNSFSFIQEVPSRKPNPG